MMTSSPKLNASCSTISTIEADTSVSTTPQAVLPTREDHSRRAIFAVTFAILFFAVALTAAIIPAARLTKNDDVYVYEPKMRQEAASVVFRLQNAARTMTRSEKDAFRLVCDNFFTREIPEMTNVNSHIESQEVVEDNSVYDNLFRSRTIKSLELAVKVQGVRSSYARSTLDSTQLVLTLLEEESTLLTSLHATGEQFFLPIQKVVATTMTQEQMDYPPTMVPVIGPKERDPVDPKACNGLVNLCDVPVNQIMFATMHNANFHRGINDMEPNHNFDVLSGLRAGVRGLSMDLGMCSDKLSLVHSSCILGYSNPYHIFSQIHQFLTDNPREVIIMPIEISGSTGGPVRLDEIDLLFHQVVDKQGKSMKSRLYQHPKWDPERPVRQPWPIVAELIEADTRIIFAHYNGAETCQRDGCPDGFHDWFLYAAETAFEYDSAAQMRHDCCRVTRGGRGLRDWFGVNVFLRVPKEDASTILNEHEFLQQRLQTCSEENRLEANLVSVDFFNTGDVLQVVNEHNAALHVNTQPE